jgi:hypothetical protein
LLRTVELEKCVSLIFKIAYEICSGVIVRRFKKQKLENIQYASSEE